MEKKKCLLSRLDVKAFTLIELLVVVLIIGILAAVALPQYKKAVLKARAAQLVTAVSTVGKAVKSYELTTGEYPDSFDVLDIDMPLEDATGGPCGLVVGTGVTTKRGKDYQIIIGKNGSFWIDVFGVFRTGFYKCTGFAYFKKTRSNFFDGEQLYCVEIAVSTADGFNRGDFCTKIMGKSYLRSDSGTDFFQ